jgi:hypothetical protein
MLKPEQAKLSNELEHAAVRGLYREYRSINHNFFANQLKACAFQLTDSAKTLGRWMSTHRTIEITRGFLFTSEWGAVIEVLKHEMAHQYVHEILEADDALPHGDLFQKVCQERGFDGRASGLPQAKSNGERPAVLQKIASLLVLAKSANQHEAELAMNTAQRLMLKYNIENVLDVTMSHYTFRHLGKPTLRTTEADKLLSCILSKHFFVACIWIYVWRVAEGKQGRVLEVCGSDDNLELASYVHTFLNRTANRLWFKYKREEGLRSNRFRREFRAGVMSGFLDKLNDEKKVCQQEGLVWVGEKAVQDYYKKRHPDRRAGRRFNITSGSTHDAGAAHGREIVLHRGVKQGPEERGPRLLPARSGDQNAGT